MLGQVSGPLPSPVSDNVFVTLWRQFWIVAALQAGDLVTTYGMLSAGGREGNLFMQDVILTPVAPMVKALALVFLAGLIVTSRQRGRPAPHRLVVAAWIIVGVYVVIVLNNVSIILYP
jgi:hypothetical protein